ncbi:hypothetical protein [Thalassobacillus sp. CUG 92003]|uniref:hypothetical protein n=1 Tax=Thalassobacillus sp. CUG 92003 TaxID=2736641 RepID=UPI0015E6C7C2|nr:hypothetical protein [Thalassobacillus sp. CUG 92003]
MTMIAVPWIFVTMNNGERVLGHVTLVTTFVIQMVTSYIGLIIDCFSRKNLLIIVQGLRAAIMGFMGRNVFFRSFATMLQVCFYFNFFYPAMLALRQELFASHYYQKINGILEIQGQISTVLAGAVALF